MSDDDRKILSLKPQAAQVKELPPHPDDVAGRPPLPVPGVDAYIAENWANDLPKGNPLDLVRPNGLGGETTRRVEQVKQERRRRADTSYEYNHRLSVNHALLDHGNFAYRFINDTSGRLHELTVNDDWDVVKDPSVKTDNDNTGAPVRKLVGANQDGSPIYAFLCRKPLQYHKEDRKRKAQRTDEMMAQIKRGAVKSPDGAAALDQSTTYIPDGGISITQAKGKVTSYQP